MTTPTTPATDVKRYSGYLFEDKGPQLLDGEQRTDYVLASAFDALAAENERLRRETALAHELRNQIADENKRLFAKNLEQQAEVGRLRADANRFDYLERICVWSVDPAHDGTDDAVWKVVFSSPYGMREDDDDLRTAIDAAMALAPSPTNSDGAKTQ